MSDSKRKQIQKAIEQMQKAEPYPISTLNSMQVSLGGTYVLNQDRLNATVAKLALDKYFAEHPEDSIENYLDHDQSF